MALLEINRKASESSDDSRILEIAEELIGTLGLQQSVPRIIWSPVAWLVERPWWLRGTLSLSSDLKGKLLPEEWRPLLAASLIYAYRFRRRRWAGGTFDSCCLYRANGNILPVLHSLPVIVERTRM